MELSDIGYRLETEEYINILARAYVTGMRVSDQKVSGEEMGKVFEGLVLERMPEMKSHDGTKLIIDTLMDHRNRRPNDE